MKKLLLVTYCGLALPVWGCGKHAQSSQSPDDGAADPAAIDASISAELEALHQPIDDAKTVAQSIRSFLARADVPKADAIVSFKASFNGTDADVSANITLEGDAQAEFDAIRAQLKTLGESLKATPDEAVAVAKSMFEKGTKGIAMATAQEQKLRAKLKMPMMNADAKAKVEADLLGNASLKASLEGKLGQLKTLPQDLAQEVTEAGAEIAAAFAS